MKTFIIDDDQISLFLVKNTLRLEKFSDDIQMFYSAEEALEWFENNQEFLPEIIFLDLNMPCMTGWEFLDFLSPRAPQFNGKCKIYILTSSFDPADIDRLPAYPMVENLIHKPLTSTDLQVIKSQFA